MSKTHNGYLLIAGITGITQYLSESELEHAQETLTALLELLVENTDPPPVISRLAGDAVISYGFREDFFLGQTFIEKIEDTYVTFRKAILEWEPFERMIVKEVPPMLSGLSAINEYRLDSVEGGTKLTKTSAKPTGPILGRMLLRLMMPVFSRILTQAMETFGREIENDYRTHHEVPELAGEIRGEQIRAASADGLQASSGNRET